MAIHNKLKQEITKKPEKKMTVEGDIYNKAE
jgi:hypothetical protein